MKTDRIRQMILLVVLSVVLASPIPGVVAHAPNIGRHFEKLPQKETNSWHKSADQVGDLRTFTVNGVSFRMVRIPAGVFMMGSPPSETGRDNDEAQYFVKITKEYWLGETEVTQGLWRAVMGSNPSHFKNCGAHCPVENVSWNDCQEFIGKLNGIVSGGSFRLPTEAEWEYACRAGSMGPYAGDLDFMGWYGNNSGNNRLDAWVLWNQDLNWDRYERKILENGGRTHPVAHKQPNAWGLYDMHGNVSEWCEDWYGRYPAGMVIDPIELSSSSGRVIRGGSWLYAARICRSAFRYRLPPTVRSDDVGFRLAMH